MSFVYNWMNQRLLETVTDLSGRAKRRVLVVSPYVGNNPWKAFHENIRSIDDVRFVIDFSRANVASGSTDPRGVEQLAEIGSVRKTQLQRDLHAKVYILDDAAIIGSPNLSLKAMGKNIETAIVITKADLVKRIANFFESLWNTATPVRQSEIDQMKEYWKQHRNQRNKSPFLPHRGETRIPVGAKWRRPVLPSGDGRHILININWSPHGYTRPCTPSEKRLYTSRWGHSCHELSTCRDEGWKQGCASSRLFSEYQYATSRKAIKKRRIAFFIAKNPHIDCQYYVCGLLYMVDSVMRSDKPHIPYTEKWNKQTVYFFKGSHGRSVKLPATGKNIVRFNAALVNQLASLRVDWSKKRQQQTEASYIGRCTRRNPRYLSEEDATTLLRECYHKTKNPRIAEILSNDFAVKAQ